MLKKQFLNNAYYGKNSWWRYLLTSLATWIGPFILIIIITTLFLIIYYPFSSHTFSRGMDLEEVFNNLNPLILLLFFGIYYTLSLLLFYFSTRIIHHKKLIQLINTASKVKWMKILKGAGLWFALMGCTLLIEVIFYPSSVNFSFNPAFFTLLILSLIIYPIQASFEEIFFRGYLMQGIRLLTQKPVIPLLVTSVIFALGHFFNGSDAGTGLGMVISMFIFGLTLGIITLGENGLETAMGVHIANNFFLTTVINSTDFFGNLPSLFVTGADSVIMLPGFILFPILLFLLFRKNWDKLGIISQKTYEYPEIGKSNQILCVNCGNKNPSIAMFCMECGSKIVGEYASTIQKTMAFIIDFILLLFLFTIALILIISIQIVSSATFNNELLAFIWIVLDILILLLYFTLLDKKGQTIGKMFLKIKVVNELDHKPIKFRQSVIRTILLVVDLIPYPLPGLLAIIFSAKSPKKQRIGDMAAGTLVIKINN